MRNLLDFLQRYSYWLVFLILEVVSLVSLFRYNSYQGSVAFTTANTVVGNINEFTSSMTAFFNLQEENEHLEAENEQLRKQLLLMEASQRNKDMLLEPRDSSLLNYQLVGAKVVNATLHRSHNLFTIDRGLADGVQPEMGVVCSTGVVGVVYLSSQHYSIVIPLLNTSSKISCKLDTTNYFGTMQWRQGDPDHSFVTGIPRHAKVKKGSKVKTNGFSDIFPEGIPVGTVTKIDDSSDGMAYELTIALATDFKTLRNVSVITNYQQAERKDLEQEADSLMNLQDR